MVKMKIGILTFHRALNYGAVLQCYALYKTLSMMGHEVEVIDYRPESIEKYRMLYSHKVFNNCDGLFNKLRYVISCMLLAYSKKKTSKKFDDFLAYNMKFSKIVYNTNDILHNYDVIVFGSDQIWNPELLYGLDPVYYGQFEKGKAKFVTYAASIGRINLITEQNENKFEEYIRCYDAISVREYALRDYLYKRFVIAAEVVCDPSLLLERKYYDEIATKPREDNYVLLFEQFRNADSYTLAKTIANQLGAHVITISAETNHLRYRPCKNISEVSPSEFLGFIKYARCVVTSSFHVTSFSIIMQKDFYATKRVNNNDRVNTILEHVGLEERLVNAGEKIFFSPINYQGIEKRIEDVKKHSLNYLKNNLK